jgi:hypothetical protein
MSVFVDLVTFMLFFFSKSCFFGKKERFDKIDLKIYFQVACFLNDPKFED